MTEILILVRTVVVESVNSESKGVPSVLVYVTQSSAKSYDEDLLTRKSVQKNILTRSTVIFRTQEFTNENDVPHLYFQGRTYEHSIQNIIVLLAFECCHEFDRFDMINVDPDELHKCIKNVEIFPEQDQEISDVPERIWDECSLMVKK